MQKRGHESYSSEIVCVANANIIKLLNEVEKSEMYPNVLRLS